MGAKTRNAILSLVAAFAALLAGAFIALLAGANPTDYLRTAIMMYAVAVVSVFIGVVITTHDDDKADRLWVGYVFGAMAVLSLAAGLGINIKMFASADMAKTVLSVVTGIDAVASAGYWYYTAFRNDDFTK